MRERNETLCCLCACFASFREGPSALLMAIISANSMIPLLIPCNSSPAPGRPKEYDFQILNYIERNDKKLRTNNNNLQT